MPLSMQTTESGWLGKTPGLIRSSIRSVAEVIKPQYGITSQINNDYNELILEIKEDYLLIFRCYNDGMAYKWKTAFKGDLPSPHVDMEHLTRYAREKGVKLILWAVWHTIDRQMAEAFDLFQKWGVESVKVDFYDCKNQVSVKFYERPSSEAAKHRLLVDYYGCSKPTGRERTYPNVINYEAGRGNEYNKFDRNETPGHNIDIVFTRMADGSMDYTSGAMRNSNEGDFITYNLTPISYGPLCHQIAMFVVY